MATQTGREPPRIGAPTWLTRALALPLLLFSCSTLAADPTEEIQSLTLQWTGLKRQRDLLESNWRSEQPVLEQQLTLLEREREALAELLEQTEQDQDEVEERRLELLERQTALEQQQSRLERELGAAIVRVRGLYPRLPPPMAAAWDEHLPRLESSLPTTSERLQSLLQMLGALDDFHRRISLHQEVMTMEDGREYLVNQFYLGLSHGWYVSTNGLYAGAGRAGRDGWVWRASNDAEAIARIIDILERRRSAELVTLRVEVGEDAVSGVP